MSRKITIGRDPHCDIRIDERYDTVSNFHAEIEYDNKCIIYVDTSTNGSLVNNQKIHGCNVEIFQGDSIVLAGVYELSWDILNQYIPRRTRPTVYRNIHSNPTAPLDGRTIRQGRATENIASRNYKKAHDSQFNTPKFVNMSKDSTQEVEEAIKHWNWGAFFCGWIWGIAHKVYWPLFQLIVAFIPFIGWIGNIIICVYLGINGSKIAWQSGIYTSLNNFKEAQRKWAIWGFVLFLISILVQGIWIVSMLSGF